MKKINNSNNSNKYILFKYIQKIISRYFIFYVVKSEK